MSLAVHGGEYACPGTIDFTLDQKDMDIFHTEDIHCL